MLAPAARRVLQAGNQINPPAALQIYTHQQQGWRQHVGLPFGVVLPQQPRGRTYVNFGDGECRQEIEVVVGTLYIGQRVMSGNVISPPVGCRESRKEGIPQERQYLIHPPVGTGGEMRRRVRCSGNTH